MIMANLIWLSGQPSTFPDTPTSHQKGLWSPRTPSTPLTPLAISPGTPAQLTLAGSPVFSLATSLAGGCERDIEKEADTLFRDHTVEEIKSIEKKTRLDIDRRKEDLRQMVGERYRDLIDAADSIMHMKKCSEQSLNSVTKMEELCQKLQQTHFLRGSGGSRGPLLKSEDHSVAAQMKLLAESPEKIWLCLEGQEYLPAAHHYLLSRHIFSQLSVKLGRGNNRDFTLIQRLWHSVACFKENILECCSCRLQCPDIQTEHMVQSLCAIMLLEGCSPRQAFAKTLLARKAAVQSVFTTGQSPQQLHRSVKSQVCELVRTIVLSLTNISTIFCAGGGKDGKSTPSLIVQSLQQFKNKERKQGGDVIPASLLERLPDSITGFSPAISTTSLTEIPHNDIHRSTEDWVTMCVSDVHSKMEGILQHITTFKALAGIREAVHSLLAQRPFHLASQNEREDEDLKVAKVREEWSHVCVSVLGRELCVWETFLRPLLLQRAKAIVDKQLGNTGGIASGLLDKLLVGLATNPADYTLDTHSSIHMWEEEQGGGMVVRSATSGTLVNPLSLKAKACSPSVFSFCQSFDQELKGLISDIAHYLGKPEVKGHLADSYLKPQHSVKVTSFPFTLFGDSGLLQDYVLEATVDCIERFLKNINNKVIDIQKELTVNKQGTAIDGLVLMGRLCYCLLDCCPSFSFLALGCRQQESVSTRSFSKSHTRTLVLRKEQEDKKPTAADILLEKATSIFKIWSQWCASEIISQLQDQLSAEMELNSLASTLAWDEIKISEEAETGEKVSSVIKVPSQTSVYVTSLLFALCQEISRVGGHALDRSILEALSMKVFIGVLERYENLLQDFIGDDATPREGKERMTVPQSCALQLLFNFKFFSSVLVHPSIEESQKVKTELRLNRIVDCLQSFVDPFDLDVFMPHVLVNLERQLTRSSVILGVLLAVKGMPSSSSFYKPTPSSNNQEKHIVIPLASSISRLPTLPVTSSSQALSNNHNTLQNVDASISSSSLLQTITFFHHL